MPHPKITTQFGFHTHLKNLTIFLLNLDEVGNLSWLEVGRGRSPPWPPCGVTTALCACKWKLWIYDWRQYVFVKWICKSDLSIY